MSGEINGVEITLRSPAALAAREVMAASGHRPLTAR
jgi:hypothetical protein